MQMHMDSQHLRCTGEHSLHPHQQAIFISELEQLINLHKQKHQAAAHQQIRSLASPLQVVMLYEMQ
jgi:hypothetical protein